MPYRSPFRNLEDDHESTHPLCLSREHHDDPELGTWDECFQAAIALCDVDADQYAFGVARQFAELSLKRLIGRPAPRSHDLTKLMRLVPTALDDDVRGFVEDLSRIDPDGDGGRYAFAGVPERPALESVCCIERDELAIHVRRLRAFVDEALVENRA